MPSQKRPPHSEGVSRGRSQRRTSSSPRVPTQSDRPSAVPPQAALLSDAPVSSTYSQPNPWLPSSVPPTPASSRPPRGTMAEIRPYPYPFYPPHGVSGPYCESGSVRAEHLGFSDPSRAAARRNNFSRGPGSWVRIMKDPRPAIRRSTDPRPVMPAFAGGSVEEWTAHGGGRSSSGGSAGSGSGGGNSVNSQQEQDNFPPPHSQSSPNFVERPATKTQFPQHRQNFAGARQQQQQQQRTESGLQQQRPTNHHIRQQRQQPQQPQQPQPQQQQQKQQSSIDQLWNLIPGSYEREGSRGGAGGGGRESLSNHNYNGGESLPRPPASAPVGNAGNKNNITSAGKRHFDRTTTPSSAARASPPGQNAGAAHEATARWFFQDVHPPLTLTARRHRARAVARLRARRRALAAAEIAAAESAAAAAAVRPPPPVKRHISDTTVETDTCSSDGENDPDGGKNAKDIDGRGVSRLGSSRGGGAYGGIGGVVRGISEGSTDHESNEVGGPSATTRESGSRPRAASATAAPARAPASAATSAGSKTASGASCGGSHTHTSKVGHLFELMRSVSANAAAAALAAEGGAPSAHAADSDRGESREVGKPVKYKYRQEAARSRKRTRGRFVSEKAPAFVSITELMALRRAERERQQQEEASPVSVGAG